MSDRIRIEAAKAAYGDAIQAVRTRLRCLPEASKLAPNLVLQAERDARIAGLEDALADLQALYDAADAALSTLPVDPTEWEGTELHYTGSRL